MLLERWGRRGLEVAGGNLERVVDICRDWKCRVTLVVYPWPDNVAVGDRDSLQVRHWQGWAVARGVRFVDGFAPFFREIPEKYSGLWSPLDHEQVLELLETENPRKPINLYINSPGGVVTSGFAMYDTMQYIQSPIHTLCMGTAWSMGSFLLMAGQPGERVALPDCLRGGGW